MTTSIGMTKLEAILASIEKWNKIVEGTGADDRSDNCPLCKMYYQTGMLHSAKSGCFNCPIMQFTGIDNCEETPYEAWMNLLYATAPKSEPSFPAKADTPEKKLAALQELNFLIEVYRAELSLLELKLMREDNETK